MATCCSDHVYFVQPAAQLNARNVLSTVAFYPTLLIILDKLWSLWLVLLYLYQRSFVKFRHTAYLFSSAKPRLSKNYFMPRTSPIFIMRNRQKTTLVPSHSISYTRLYIDRYKRYFVRPNRFIGWEELSRCGRSLLLPRLKRID